MIIVDSSILIDWVRGVSSAATYLDSLVDQGSLSTHVVAIAEVLVGARSQIEQKAIDRRFARMDVQPITDEDSRRSLDVLRHFRLSHGIGWHDCLIAATCLRLDASLATLNVRHFSPVLSLKVIRPY